MTIDEALRKYWGFDGLLPLQADVLEAAFAGKDALVVMPTGGGKSLCFQLPPIVSGGLTLVVSPLISLMKDQVDGLQLIGYPAAALNSNIDAASAREIGQGLKLGEIKLLYVSPERAVTPGFIDTVSRADNGKGVARIAIDEAHCISQWGHDFRQEYRQLLLLREAFPAAPFMALTATATPRVREDIVAQLQLRDPEVLVGVFDRPNLTYRIVPKGDKIAQIEDAVRRHPNDAAIVYCISRKDTERVAQALSGLGLAASAYHAGLEAHVRRKISEGFAQERVNIVVATVAFGMGIDRSNVRCVIHESMPKSIEAYQQETGRAGRDGLPSECLMLYSGADVARWQRLIELDGPSEHSTRQKALIDEVRKFAVGTECRHKFLSEYFGQTYVPPKEDGCGTCDICLDGWRTVKNSTRVAHQIIATVSDLAGRHGDFGFGAAHIAGILSGSRRDAILKFGHDGLRGYGAMRPARQARISGYINQLIDNGLLGRTGSQFPQVCLTQESVDVLAERREVTLREFEPPRTSKLASVAGLSDARQALFEAMREKRREIAVERGVPAYVIFLDATLIDIARRLPNSIEALQEIAGVGEKRAVDLGPEFLPLVERHREAIYQERPRGSSLTAARLRPFFEKGADMEQITKQVELAESTVSNYLADWIADTCPDSIDRWVDPRTADKIRSAIVQCGAGPLKPIYQALDEQVPYHQIRIVMGHARSPREPVAV